MSNMEHDIGGRPANNSPESRVNWIGRTGVQFVVFKRPIAGVLVAVVFSGLTLKV
jgi:hypothetical protein